MQANLRAILASSIVSLFVLPAYAQPAVAGKEGWYAGVGFGQSELTDWYEESDILLEQDAFNDGLAATGVVRIEYLNGMDIRNNYAYTDDGDSTAKLFVGHRFNSNFALEFSYVDPGETGAEAGGNGIFLVDNPLGFPAPFIPYVGTENITVTAESKILTIDMVGLVDINPHFELFGKLGVNRADSELTYRGTLLLAAPNLAVPTSATVTTSDDSVDLHLAVGANIWFSPVVGLRFEWEQIRGVEVDYLESDIEIFSSSLLYHF